MTKPPDFVRIRETFTGQDTADGPDQRQGSAGRVTVRDHRGLGEPDFAVPAGDGGRTIVAFGTGEAMKAATTANPVHAGTAALSASDL
jgi:hypothetical protein